MLATSVGYPAKTRLVTTLKTGPLSPKGAAALNAVLSRLSLPAVAQCIRSARTGPPCAGWMPAIAVRMSSDQLGAVEDLFGLGTGPRLDFWRSS